MPKLSFDKCPWCRSQIELLRSSTQYFHCPICNCEFQHNYRKWIIGIPVTLAVCLLLFNLPHGFRPPISIAVSSIPISIALISWMPTYMITESGIQPIPKPTQSQAYLDHLVQEESRQLTFKRPKQLAIGLLIILIPIAIVVLIFYLCW